MFQQPATISTTPISSDISNYPVLGYATPRNTSFGTSGISNDIGFNWGDIDIGLVDISQSRPLDGGLFGAIPDLGNALGLMPSQQNIP
jgi:hypothetical protein